MPALAQGGTVLLMPIGLVIVGKGSHRLGDKNKWAQYEQELREVQRARVSAFSSLNKIPAGSISFLPDERIILFHCRILSCWQRFEIESFSFLLGSTKERSKQKQLQPVWIWILSLSQRPKYRLNRVSKKTRLQIQIPSISRRKGRWVFYCREIAGSRCRRLSLQPSFGRNS